MQHWYLLMQEHLVLKLSLVVQPDKTWILRVLATLEVMHRLLRVPLEEMHEDKLFIETALFVFISSIFMVHVTIFNSPYEGILQHSVNWSSRRIQILRILNRKNISVLMMMMTMCWTLFVLVFYWVSDIVVKCLTRFLWIMLQQSLMLKIEYILGGTCMVWFTDYAEGRYKTVGRWTKTIQFKLVTPRTCIIKLYGEVMCKHSHLNCTCIAVDYT